MKTIYIIIAFTLCFFTQNSQAQTQFLVQEKYQHKVSFSTGLEPAVIYNLRYDMRTKLPFTNIRASYFAKAEASFFRTFAENSEWTIGTQLLLWEKSKFQLLYETGIVNGRLQTKLYDVKKWEWNHTLEAGLFGEKSALALFTTYNQNVGLKLIHSDFYKETIYGEGQEGWFKGVGAYFDFGVKGQILVRERLSIALQLKTSVTSGGKALNILPAQASVGIGWRM